MGRTERRRANVRPWLGRSGTRREPTPLRSAKSMGNPGHQYANTSSSVRRHRERLPHERHECWLRGPTRPSTSSPAVRRRARFDRPGHASNPMGGAKAPLPAPHERRRGDKRGRRPVLHDGSRSGLTLLSGAEDPKVADAKPPRASPACRTSKARLATARRRLASTRSAAGRRPPTAEGKRVKRASTAVSRARRQVVARC